MSVMSPFLNLFKFSNSDNTGHYKHFFHWLSGICTIIILAFLLAPPMRLHIASLSVGDISPTSIKAPADFSVEDQQTTVKRQNEALSQVRAIYDFDPDITQVNKKINILFSTKNQVASPVVEEVTKPAIATETAQPDKKEAGIKKSASTNQKTSSVSSAPKKLSIKERWELFNNSEGVLPISFDTFNILQNPLFDIPIHQAANALVASVMKKGIVGNKELLLEEKSIIRRDLKAKKEVIIDELGKLWDMEEAKTEIKNMALKNLVADKQSLSAIIEIAQLAITPNLFFNKSATEESKKEVINSVKPVYYQLKKGEMIVREGERVRMDHLVKLNELKLLSNKNMMPIFLSGITILLVILTAFMYVYLKNFHPKIVENTNQIYLLTVILVSTFLLSRLFIFLSTALSAFTPQVSVSAYSYAIPFALGGLLTAVLVEAQLGIIFSLVAGILAAIQMGNDFVFFLLAAIGGCVAVYSVTHTKQRTVLIQAGLLVGIANIIIVIPTTLMKGELLFPQMFHDCIGGLIGGLLVATLVSALLPVLESLFKITTDIKLLELSDMNQPLLKQLALAAPGTYQHSIVVGSLAEAAAEVIGANSLLARIASYYHDIGKISKAEYFIENLVNQENKHSRLAPSMSSLIINSHVKEGIELAKQYNLPPLIIEIIKQHHGTSLIKFFYQKAKQQEKAHLQVVKEKEFSYPGPKPQTKECGIIMLADVLEASSRSIVNPTPQKLEELVHRTTHDIYNAGQLDECDLTFKNLTQISAAFVRILTSVFHPRIEYPKEEVENTAKQDTTWKSISTINKQTKKYKNLS